MAIKTARPMPIVSAFGSDSSNELNLTRYLPSVDQKDQNSVAVAHLAAYIYYYKNWNAIRRQQIKDHFKAQTGGSGASSHFFAAYSSAHDDESAFNVGSWTPEMDEAHSQWCREHFINPSGVKS